MNRVSVFFLAIGLLLVGCGESSVTQAPSVSDSSRETTLRLNVTEGQKFAVIFDVETSAASQDMSAKVGAEMVVQQVKGGETVMAYVIKSVDVTPEASPTAPNPLSEMIGKTFSVTFDRRNQVVGSEGMPPGFDMGTESGVKLPEKPIKQGDKWEETETEDGLGLTAAYEVLGFEKVNGRDAAKIAMTISAPAIKMSGRGTTWIDTEWGIQVRSELESSFEMMGSTAKMAMKMDVQPR